MAHKYAEVIKAFVSGEVVQYKYGEPFEWQDSSLKESVGTMPNFDSIHIMWRLKPKPITLTYALVLRNSRRAWSANDPYRLSVAHNSEQLLIMQKAPDFIKVLRPCETIILPEGI